MPGRAGSPLPCDGPIPSPALVCAQLFDIFNRHAKTISRVTFWGVSDTRSWRRGQAALAFDGQLQPKPALQAIINVGLGKGMPSQP